MKVQQLTREEDIHVVLHAFLQDTEMVVESLEKLHLDWIIIGQSSGQIYCGVQGTSELGQNSSSWSQQ